MGEAKLSQMRESQCDELIVQIFIFTRKVHCWWYCVGAAERSSQWGPRS